MAGFYVRDDRVRTLAEELQSLTGKSSKTAAIRDALTDAVERAKADKLNPPKRRSVEELLAPIMKRADELGPVDPNFDQKKFFDDEWGDS